MSLLGSLSRTSSGSFSTKTQPAGSSVMTLLCPRLHQPLPLDQSRHRRRRDLHLPARRPNTLHATSKQFPPPPLHSSTSESTESLFLNLLARASLCKKHARPLTSLHRPPPSRQIPRCAQFSTKPRSNDTAHASALDDDDNDDSDPSVETNPDSASAHAHIPREALRSIVDIYDHVPYQEELPPDRDAHNTPKSSRFRQPRAPLRDPLPAETTEQEEAIEYLSTLLADELSPHSLVLDAYKALPSPGVAYLPNYLIRNLFHHFMVVEYPDEDSMLRYLALVDDMFAANIPMRRAEWNSAIHFAGNYARKVTDLQVETATQIWLRMEREASIPSSGVTFNILFDIAIKAGKFALAEVIMKEMVQRDVRPNRYFRTNKIFYCGLKGDGDGVRAAYKELVDAGTFVDTVVLNCVIASLIRAGEASAAEFMFQRMKTMGAEKQGGQTINISDWRSTRDLGKVLQKAAVTLRDQPEQRAVVQDATPVSPDLATYRLLIKYHALESGNIDRVSELLHELNALDRPLHGSFFLHIFRGFSIHGGVRYSSWNKAKLDQLWTTFCDLAAKNNTRTDDPKFAWVSEEDRGCYFDVPVVKVVLQAYYTVAGKEVTIQVWENTAKLWKPRLEVLESVNGSLAWMFM